MSATSDVNSKADSLADTKSVEDTLVAAEGKITTLKEVRAEQRRQLFRKPTFLIGLVVTLFWIVAAIFPALFTNRQPKQAVKIDGSSFARRPPSGDAWFGTDSIGNDVFARVIYGARDILLMAPAIALLAVVGGTFFGLLMGYYRGWIDEILSRIIEAILSIPVLLLGLLVLTLFGRTRLVIVLTVAALFIPVVTRTVRAAVMGETELDYVTAAKLRGESGLFIMAREILPTITGVLVVEFTVRVAYAIFTVATLAFLGLSFGDATDPDWGKDIAGSYQLVVADQWWGAVFPGLAIATLIIAINLIADAIDEVTTQ